MLQLTIKSKFFSFKNHEDIYADSEQTKVGFCELRHFFSNSLIISINSHHYVVKSPFYSIKHYLTDNDNTTIAEGSNCQLIVGSQWARAMYKGQNYSVELASIKRQRGRLLPDNEYIIKTEGGQKIAYLIYSGWLKNCIINFEKNEEDIETIAFMIFLKETLDYRRG